MAVVLPEHIGEVQALAKVELEHAPSGKQESAVGQFKEVRPLEGQEGVAVAVVKASKAAQALEDIKHEAHLLSVLRENGYPALQTHGEVFEVEGNKFALLMDWIPNANLIDSKAPDALPFLLPAMMLGIPVNTGKEAWAMNAAKISSQISAKTADSDLNKVQTFAKTLGEEFQSLKAAISEKGLVIGDLQILVSQEGKITIIDPLDVLKIVPKDPADPSKGVDLVDIVNPDKPNRPEFLRSLQQSFDMIDKIINFCEQTCKAKSTAELARVFSPRKTFDFSIPYDSTMERRAHSAPTTPSTRRIPIPEPTSRSLPSSPQEPRHAASSRTSRSPTTATSSPVTPVARSSQPTRRAKALTTQLEIDEAGQKALPSTPPKRPETTASKLRSDTKLEAEKSDPRKPPSRSL